MISITPIPLSFNFQNFNDFYKDSENNIPDEINIPSDEISIESDGISFISDGISIEPDVISIESDNIPPTVQEEEMDIQKSKPVRKQTKTTRKVHKVGRSFIPQGPNVTRTEEERAAGIFSDKAVIQHAGNRVVDFLLSSEVLWELNLTSTPGEKRDLVVKILSALYQGEKGVNKKKKKGEVLEKAHGGHDNAGAGLDINIRRSLIDRIITKGEITPKTQKIMQYRGFCTPDFEKIKESYDSSNVESVFKRVWAAHPKRPDYVFEGTRINEKVNRTTEISMDVNLFVDKKLEGYIRPIIIKLYEKILNGTLTPKAATTQYATDILYFFTKLEKNLREILTLVKEYQEEFALIGDFNTISAEKCKTSLNNLNKIIQKMCPKKPKKIDPAKKKPVKKKKATKKTKSKTQPKEASTPTSTETSTPTSTETSTPISTETSTPTSTPQTDSPKPSLNPRMIRMNKEFIRQNNLEADKPELFPDMLKGVKNWGERRGPALLAEMQKFYKQIETYVKSVVLEKEGTVDIDDEQYTALFGEFNPKSGKREVTDQSIEAARARLWGPPTPLNKRLREEDEETTPIKPPKMRRLSLN